MTPSQTETCQDSSFQNRGEKSINPEKRKLATSSRTVWNSLVALLECVVGVARRLADGGTRLSKTLRTRMITSLEHNHGLFGRASEMYRRLRLVV